MKKLHNLLLAFALLLSSQSRADLSGAGLTDYKGNGITSQVSGSGRALDVGVNVAGVQVDPRTRTWTLLNSTDSVNSVQSGVWTMGRTWNLSSGADSVSSVQSGAWSVTANAGTNLNTSALALETGGHLASIDAGLGTINTTLGSPFQAGGSIGNSAFGISGTLPAYAATPTFNLGTLNGAATNATLLTINSTLGTPFQAAGSIGNTSFGATQATAANLNATVFQGTSPWVVSGSTTISGTIAATQSGIWSQRLQDGSGNAITSQVSSTQRALDVGIDVGGTQIDPRAVRALTSADTVTVVQPTGTNLHTAVDNFPATQPISGTVTANAGTNLNTSLLALESGGHLASADAKLSTINTTLGTPFQAGGSIANTSFGISGSLPSFATTPTFNLGTLNGAATAAKQPALGVAGTASTDVITVQGIASMTPLKTDGSATTQPVSGSVSVSNFPATQPVSGTVAVSNFPATQPVSGTVTSNIGTTGGLALDSTLSSTRGSASGGTAAASSTLSGGIYNSSAPTLTTGQQASLQLDVSGNLKTSGTATVSGTVAATQSGTWTVQQGTPPWSVSQSGAWTTGRTWSLLNTTDSVNSVQSGAWTTGRTWSLASGTDSVASVQSGAWTSGRTWTTSSTTDSIVAVGNVASGASDSGNPLKTGGVFNTTQPTVTTGQRVDTQSTARGALIVATGLDALNVGNITGTISLPTGAATLAAQTTGNGSLATIASATDVNISTRSSAANQTNGTQKTQVVDGSGNVQPAGDIAARAIKVDNSAVNQPVTQVTSPWVVSGTVTANAGTNLNTSALALDASVVALQVAQGSTSSGQKGGLTLGAVTTAAPAYTTAQSSPLSLTTAGALRTDASATVQPASQSGTWTTGRTWSLLNSTDSVNSVQSGAWTTGRTWTLGSGTDSATVIQGTSPWVDNISQFGGVNLSTGTGTSGTGIPRVTVANDSNILATQSGTWTVQQGGTPTAVANAWTIKLTDGTNTTAVKAASTAALATDPSAVVALSPNSPLPTGTNNVGSITNVTGTVSLPTGAATSALQTTGNTTLSTISTAQTSGAQKTQVVDGSGVVQGPMMANNGVNHAPVYLPLDVTQASVNVTAQDTASTSNAGFAGQTLITGTPTAASTAAYALNSIQTVMVLISGTWTGTLSTEVSEDGGTTWESRSVHVVGTSTFASAITANMAGSMNASAKTNVRIRATAAMTGTAAIKILISDNPSNMYVANALRLVDGSSTPNTNTLTIKSASTPAVATDTAAVVAISPGTPISTKTALTANSPFTVSVGVASGVYLALNASRKGFCTVNTSNATVSFGLAGAAAVLNSGITLYPGGTWCMDEFTFTTGAINAIAGTAASGVAGQEFQ